MLSAPPTGVPPGHQYGVLWWHGYGLTWCHMARQFAGTVATNHLLFRFAALSFQFKHSAFKKDAKKGKIAQNLCFELQKFL